MTAFEDSAVPMPSSGEDAEVTAAASRVVLVADDDAMVRQLVRMLIESNAALEDVCIHEARDGREAVEVTAVTPPDVIVLDVEMPFMDGISALPLLRAAAPAARIVMCSGRDERREEALDAGANLWLSKHHLAQLPTHLFGIDA